MAQEDSEVKVNNIKKIINPNTRNVMKEYNLVLKLQLFSNASFFCLKVLKVTIVLIFSESRFAKRSYEELANVAKELKKAMP